MYAGGTHPFFANGRLVLTNYKLTISQIRYLIYLYRLSQGGCGVKNVELAASLGLSKPSVHNMLRSLNELRLVSQEAFGLAHLTDEGYSLAQRYAACFAVTERKMAEAFGHGTVSESAVCGVLADMSPDVLESLYDSTQK